MGAESARVAASAHNRAGHSPVLDVVRSGGTQLPEELREHMEARFGSDFSRVRIHADETAHRSAQSINALAYTVGEHIAFQKGAYDPATTNGRARVAHELVHVIQQRSGPVDGTEMSGGLRVSDPGDRFEREASTIAERYRSAGREERFEVNRGPEAAPSAQFAVQRCGDDQDCACATEDEGAHSAVPVQREARPGSTPAGEQQAAPAGRVSPPGRTAARGTPSRGPVFGSALSLPTAEARQLITEFGEVLAPFATRVVPWPDGRVGGQPIASAQPGSAAPASVQAMVAQRLATVQRDGGDEGHTAVEGGVVGSVQVCYDVCTGEVDINGWIWGGVGGHLPVVGWVGPYVYYEGSFYKGNPGLGHLNCGTCDPNCRAPEGGGHGGWGVGGFPVHITPGQRAVFSRGGLEVGLLVSPHSLCDADIEVIALINMLGYLGPVGAAITRFVDATNQLAARYGLKLTAEFGAQVNVSGHLCRARGGGVTADHVNGCGGGYIGLGLGLSRNKADHPH
jgi:hypothetical protein